MRRTILFLSLLITVGALAQGAPDVETMRTWFRGCLIWTLIASAIAGLVVGWLHISRLRFRVGELSLRRRAWIALTGDTAMAFSAIVAFVLLYARIRPPVYSLGSFRDALAVVLLSEWAAYVIAAGTSVFAATAFLIARLLPKSNTRVALGLLRKSA